MFRIVEQTQAQMQQGYFSNSNIYVDGFGKLTLRNNNIAVNYALNKPYTKTNNAPFVSGRSDVGNKMFTDGDISKDFRYDRTSGEEITVDLGAELVIGGTNYYGDSTVASNPDYVETLVSNDNQNFISMGDAGDGTNWQGLYYNSFNTKARYVKFHLKNPRSPYAINVIEGEIFAGVTYTAYREQTYDLSSVQTLRTNNIYWVEEKPPGTSILVESSVSLDGGMTWSSWMPLYNGGVLTNISLGTDISNGQLKIKITLQTNNITVPTFSNLYFYFDDVPKSDDSYIIIPRNAYSLKRINPDMTSANSPSPYVVMGTGVNISTYPLWKAFDGLISTGTNSDAWATQRGHYITLEVGEENKKAISQYRIHRHRSNYSITSFQIEGSNDNINWTLIDKRDQLSWVIDEESKQFPIDLSKANVKNTYRFFKFTILDSSSTTGSIFIEELQFFELVDGNGYQIKSIVTVPHRHNIVSSVLVKSPYILFYKENDPSIPKMDSYTSPRPYVASASSEARANTAAWQAFDKSIASSANMWMASNPSNQWLQIDCGEGNRKYLTSYQISPYNGIFPTSWRLEGSNDGVTWDILDQRSQIFSLATSYNILPERLYSSYRYFRLFAITVNSGNYMVVGELEFFGFSDARANQLLSHFTVPESTQLLSHIYIPPSNRATGTVRILPLIKYELPSKVAVKIHDNLVSRVNVPINNRASGIVNIVKRPTTTISLPPEKDAFVRQSIPKLNYGSEQDMYAGFNTNYNEIYRSFVGFDTSSIPNNAEIKSAHFRFYNELNSSPIQKIELFEVAADWTEKGITWDNQPKPKDKIGELEVGSAGGYLYADFTDIVREWYEGTKVNRGFVMKVTDETETYYKRFYTRESNLPPSLEIEYYDKTVYTFEKIDILGKALIRQQADKDLTSRLNVKQIWFDHGIPSRLKVANMGTVDSHLIVKDPNLPSRITVKQTDNEDLISRITVRVKLERTFTSEVTVNKPFQFGRIRVRRRDTRELSSKVRVRVGGQKDFPSSVNISKGFVHSRVSVVRSEYLTSRVVVAGLGNRTLRGQLIIRRSDSKDIASHLRIFQKELLASRVHVVSGYLKSRVHIPFRANMDQPSRVRIRVRQAKDMMSRVRIEDPYGDSWAYVYIL